MRSTHTSALHKSCLINAVKVQNSFCAELQCSPFRTFVMRLTIHRIITHTFYHTRFTLSLSSFRFPSQCSHQKNEVRVTRSAAASSVLSPMSHSLSACVCYSSRRILFRILFGGYAITTIVEKKEYVSRTRISSNADPFEKYYRVREEAERKEKG